MGMGSGTLAHHAGGSCRSASLLTKAQAPQSAPLRCQLLRGMFWFAKGVKRDGRPPAFLWFLFNIGFRQIGKTPRSQQRRGWFPPRSSQRRMPCAGCCSLVSPPWCPHLHGTAKPLGFGPFPLTLPLSKQGFGHWVERKSLLLSPPLCSLPNSLSLSNFRDARNDFLISAPPCSLLDLPVGLTLPDSQEHLRTDGHTLDTHRGAGGDRHGGLAAHPAPLPPALPWGFHLF